MINKHEDMVNIKIRHDFSMHQPLQGLEEDIRTFQSGPREG